MVISFMDDDYCFAYICAIDNIWVTPSYRGKKTSHEALLLVLDNLFRSGGLSGW